jgi:hypothetical protein
MQYRTDINFDEAGYQAIMTAAANLSPLITPYVKFVKPEDRTAGQNMGEGNGWTYVKKAFAALTNDRTLAHVKNVNYDAFARGVDAATKFLAIKTALKGWYGDSEGTFMQIGLDLMEQSNYVRATLKGLAEEDSDSKILYDDLNFLYDNRAKKAADTIENQKRIDVLSKQVESLQKKAE